MSQKNRRTYTPEQRADAVKIALASDESIGSVARNLAISASSLSRWIRDHRREQEPTPSETLSSDERQELVALRRQVQQLTLERDFIKKAAAFFARDLS